jgi:hypothetical protein
MDLQYDPPSGHFHLVRGDHVTVFASKLDPKRHCTGYAPLTGRPCDAEGRMILAWQYGPKPPAPSLFDEPIEPTIRKRRK